MSTFTNIAKAARRTAALAGAALLALTTACDRAIYDYEGDCEVNYLLKFRYDKNLKWADAFASEVGSVRVYAFDADGILYRQYSDNSEQLQQEGYTMKLDLPAGKWHLVAWCGVDNPQAEGDHFAVPEMEVGKTTLDELNCLINREADEMYAAVSDKRLEFLFHGDLDVELPEDEDGGDHIYTMPLTKNTNHLRIVLQHLSGEDLDVSQFAFRLEDANGFYHHNNTLLDDDAITYKAYKLSSGTAAIVRDSEAARTRDYKTATTAVADISTGRMMADRKRDMLLTITNGEGTDIARIPVIDYALMAKDYYEDAYGHKMTDQEFLDREDEYMMTFFIDENMEWYAAEIYILSWRIVLHNYEI